VWQAVCIVGGYKEECMLRRQGTVSYWCCQYGKKAYPDDLMRTFAYDPHRLGAQISPQQFRKLGMMALDERSLLPAAETRSVAAVSFETTPSLKIHMQLSVAEIMAQAQPQMECEELVMRPGTDEGSANVTRTCQQKQQPAKKPGNRAKQISPAKKDRAAMAPKALALRVRKDSAASRRHGVAPVRHRHRGADNSTERAHPHDQGNTASRFSSHGIALVRHRHRGADNSTERAQLLSQHPQHQGNAENGPKAWAPTSHTDGPARLSRGQELVTLRRRQRALTLNATADP